MISEDAYVTAGEKVHNFGNLKSGICIKCVLRYVMIEPWGL